MPGSKPPIAGTTAPDEQLSVGADTRTYAVFGHPVAHSLSPLMHNRAFAATAVNAVYLAFDITDLAAAMAGVRAMGIDGLSVTIPHKIDIMAHLDRIEDAARRIGAVNTVYRRDGLLVGDNTDGPGAVDALKGAITLDGRTVAVVGAGGAARAIGYAVTDAGAKVVVVNRSIGRGEHLAADLNADFCPLDSMAGLNADVLVHTTPVGMSPHGDAMAVPAGVLQPGMVVMDVVYNPMDTMLLRTARRIGCTVIDGVAMFVGQGARQFACWTGQAAPVELMRNTVVAALTTRKEKHP